MCLCITSAYLQTLMIFIQSSVVQTEKFQDFSPCWISELYWKLWDAFTSLTLIKFTNVVCFSSGFYNRCAYGSFFWTFFNCGIHYWDVATKISILRYKNELKFRSFDITQDTLDISLPFCLFSDNRLSTVLIHINYVQFDYMQK